MKRILLIATLFLATVLAGCEIHMAHEVFDYDYNPFLKRVELEKSGNEWEDGEDNIRFLVFTDAHIGRHDSKVTDRSGKVLEIAEDHDFVMSLGDLSDDGNISYGPLKDFLAAMGKKDVPFLGILGNHELQSDRMRDEWEALYHGNGLFGTLGCYTYGPLSIYALDSSLRIFTLAQLEALEQALAQDGNPYKVFITHTDITSGEGLNQSLIFTLGTADVAEQNRLYRLMDQYGVGLMMDGHRHSGGGLIHVSRSFWEYNHDALHTRDAGLFESRGCYYVYTLDVNTGRLTIDKHLAEDGSLISTQSITI